mgnify:CR=1 FL=1
MFLLLYRRNQILILISRRKCSQSVRNMGQWSISLWTSTDSLKNENKVKKIKWWRISCLSLIMFMRFEMQEQCGTCLYPVWHNAGSSQCATITSWALVCWQDDHNNFHGNCYFLLPFHLRLYFSCGFLIIILFTWPTDTSSLWGEVSRCQVDGSSFANRWPLLVELFLISFWVFVFQTQFSLIPGPWMFPSPWICFGQCSCRHI